MGSSWTGDVPRERTPEQEERHSRRFLAFVFGLFLACWSVLLWTLAESLHLA